MAFFRRFNEWFAVRATRVFGTMWAFYAFAVYGLMPLLFPEALDHLLYWSNVVQLIALPLLAVGQSVMGRAGERQAKETHDAVMAELELLREERAQLAAVLVALAARTADTPAPADEPSPDTTGAAA